MITALVLVVGSLLTWLRLPAGAGDSLYAEDGALFVKNWTSDSSWTLLFEPYAGYQHFIPRVVSALVVSTLPVTAFGMAITFLSCVLVGACASLTYHFARDVVSSRWARTGLAGIPILLPLAGYEPIGNLANFHWYAMYLMPWVLLSIPRSNRGAFATAFLAFALAMTEPQTLIFLPLGIVRCWRPTRSRVVFSGFLLGMAGQLWTFLTTDRPRVPGSPPILSTLEGYLINAPLIVFTGNRVDTGRALQNFGWWIAYASLALFIAGAVVTFVLGSGTVRLVILALILASAASWIASFVLNNLVPGYYSELTPEQLALPPIFRWGTSAGMLLSAVIPLLAGVLADRGGRASRIAPVLVLGLLGVMALTFRSEDNTRGSDTPTWTQETDRAGQVCRTSGLPEVQVGASPLAWRFTLPCPLFDE
ncbi:hypothetical protein JL107_18040 [Nakamurella flavida]|uniref:Uncharacterized protein n=1 Tax=Nakamurella flavida TaxID=363630 RepID=A0A938YRX8_9ACTN|nr:hypothetical protein [Nakamurella flavida]MBM9478354.1 hypothetical protein [Nakamurella flavida]MDP9777474.1 hypothetical protein [Nakamurella flavida]